MVLNNDTLEVLHDLTEEGKQRYSDYLEMKADDILFKASKPFRYAIYKMREKLEELKETYIDIKETILFAIQSYLNSD